MGGGRGGILCRGQLPAKLSCPLIHTPSLNPLKAKRIIRIMFLTYMHLYYIMSERMWRQLALVVSGINTSIDIQPDQINMAAFFWYLVISDLFSVG